MDRIVPGIATRMTRLQDGRPRVLVQWEHSPHVRSPHGHLHGEVEQSRVTVPHSVFVQ